MAAAADKIDAGGGLMSARSCIFVMQLLQDVAILRPLVFVASHAGLRCEIMVLAGFQTRDTSGVWTAELHEIAESSGALVAVVETPFEVHGFLQGKAGVLIGASESSLSGHSELHDMYRAAPPTLVTVCVQHGFEGVGLLQSRQHDIAHGEDVVFAADVVCVWCDPARLTSVLPSQRSKLYLTGPPAVLQSRPRQEGAVRLNSGIVCENLHSARLNASGDFTADFTKILADFCAELLEDKRTVVLRPHPGGQYVIREGLALAGNVVLNNNPIYKVDLAGYAFGLSAPSTILVDMVLAGIPTAVWLDGGNLIDARNYDGLTVVRTLRDWLDFADRALRAPASFLDGQTEFLAGTGLLLDPAKVYERFATLLVEAAHAAPSAPAGL